MIKEYSQLPIHEIRNKGSAYNIHEKLTAKPKIMMKHQGYLKADRSKMMRVFGEPEKSGNYLLNINGRQAKVSYEDDDKWAVEAENMRIFSKILTLILTDNG